MNETENEVLLGALLKATQFHSLKATQRIRILKDSLWRPGYYYQTWYGALRRNDNLKVIEKRVTYYISQEDIHHPRRDVTRP